MFVYLFLLRFEPLGKGKKGGKAARKRWRSGWRRERCIAGVGGGEECTKPVSDGKVTNIISCKLT